MEIDVAIVGAGPAGLTAGMFACRAGLKTICFEKLFTGGQVAISHVIPNYPGIENIEGAELSARMESQAKSFGLNVVYESVELITKNEDGTFKINTRQNVYNANKVIIACGCRTRKLGLDKEDALTGHGVSYCASCDGNFFKDKVVAVVGGGNSAMKDALYLSKLAKKIYIINRSERFRADKIELENIKALPNVEFITSAIVTKLYGENNLDGIDVVANNQERHLSIDGLFVAVGFEPDTSFVDIDLEKDKFGYIVVNNKKMTSVKNLYACGDIVSDGFKQIVVACADGAIAANDCAKD